MLVYPFFYKNGEEKTHNLNNHRVGISLQWEEEKESIRERQLFYTKPAIASAWLSMEALMSH